MTNTTPAPRPAACDLDAARKLARQLAGTTSTGTVAWDAALAIRALAADLAATRAERDAANAELDASGVEWTHWQRKAEAAEAERDAALAALPDADTLDRAACRIDQFSAGGAIAMHCLQDAAARIRALDTAAADVPPFLAHRVNGGR